MRQRRNVKRTKRTKRITRNKKSSSCGSGVNLNYRSPINSLPLDRDFSLKGGYSACTSYKIDLEQPNVGGQSIISGNPDGCLGSQMNNTTNFGHTGGGASCAGVGLDLSQQIAGKPVILNYSPNCLYGETSGGGNKSKSKSKSKSKRKHSKDDASLKKSITNYCKQNHIKCDKKFKDDLYKIIKAKLCN